MQTLVREYEAGLLKAEGEVPTLKPGDFVRLKINIYAGGSDHIVGLKKIHRIAAKGMITLDQSIKTLFLNGYISREDALAKANLRDWLNQALSA